MTPTSFVVSWPAETVGTAPFVYITEHRVSGTPVWTDNPLGVTPNLSQPITGLTPGTAYEVRVKVINAVGSNFSPSVIQATPTTSSTESVEGTLVPPSTSLTNGDGAIFTITVGKQVAVNGVIDGTTSNLIELYYHNHAVYREESNGNSLGVIPGWWFKVHASDPWTPTQNPLGQPTPTESAEGTAVPPGSSITDVDGDAFTLLSSTVRVNGANDTFNAGAVTSLYYHNHAVYQQSTATNSLGDHWWFKAHAGNAWVATTSPIASPKSVSVGTIASQVAGVPFTVSGTLTGYSSAPTLEYQDNQTGSWLPLPSGSTVTTTTFSFTHPAMTASGTTSAGSAGGRALATAASQTVTNNVVVFTDDFNSFSGTPTGSATQWMTHYPFAGSERTLSANGELEYFSDLSVTSYNPFSVSGGVLTITADTVAHTTINPLNLPYNSGAFTSATEVNSNAANGLFARQYGYFEARMLLPGGPGIWPAFWLMPIGGGAGEIDIMEAIGQDTTHVYQTLHYTGSTSADQVVVLVSDYTTNYHLYGVNWQADFITFYVDRVQTLQRPTPTDMTRPYYILFDLAVGGSFPGNPSVGDPNAVIVLAGSGGSFTDNFGHVWTISGGNAVLEDGSPAAFTANVAKIALVFGNQVWHENTSVQWYKWDQSTSGWNPGSDPTVTTLFPSKLRIDSVNVYSAFPGTGVTPQLVTTFLSSLGINTHIDQGFSPTSYVTPLQFTGIQNIRTGFSNISGAVTVHNSTSAMVNVFGSSNLTSHLAAARTLATAGALLSLEGPNEPNNFPFSYLGNTGGGSGTWVPVAQYQRDLYAGVKADTQLQNFPVFHVSEGGGEVDNVGMQFLTIPNGSGIAMPDGTQYADYANPHNYVSGNLGGAYVDNTAWNAADPTMNSSWDGLFVEYGRTWRGGFTGYSNTQLQILPRVTSETGWDSTSLGETVQGKVLLNTYCAQFARGWRYTFIYEMFDQEASSGNQGLYRSDKVTAKLAATYIHNMTTILTGGTNIGTTPFNYAIASQPATVHDLLLQKTANIYDLIVWGEQVSGSNNIVVNLASNRSSVKVFDPTVGTTAVQTLTNVSSVALTVSDHPFIVEVTL